LYHLRALVVDFFQIVTVFFIKCCGVKEALGYRLKGGRVHRPFKDEEVLIDLSLSFMFIDQSTF
jgi:hypothetical protein